MISKMDEGKDECKGQSLELRKTLQVCWAFTALKTNDGDREKYASFTDLMNGYGLDARSTRRLLEDIGDNDSVKEYSQVTCCGTKVEAEHITCWGGH